MNNKTMLIGTATRSADKAGLIDLHIQLDGQPIQLQLQPTTPGHYSAKARIGTTWKPVGNARDLAAKHMGRPMIEMTFSATGARLELSPQKADGTAFLVFAQPPAAPAAAAPTVKAAAAKGLAPRRRLHNPAPAADPLAQLTAALLQASAAVLAIAQAETKASDSRRMKTDRLLAARRASEMLILQIDRRIEDERMRLFIGPR